MQTPSPSRRQFLTQTGSGVLVIGVAGTAFAQVAPAQTPAAPTPTRAGGERSKAVEEYLLSLGAV